MTARFVAVPRRYSDANDGGDDAPCSPERAELSTVVDATTGAVACRCGDVGMAERIAGGLDALDAVEALKADREACRQAACFALGIDCDTLELAIEALVAGRADAIRKVLGIGRAWSDDLIEGGSIIASDDDVAAAREALEAAHIERVQRFEGEGVLLGSERGQ